MFLLSTGFNNNNNEIKYVLFEFKFSKCPMLILQPIGIAAFKVNPTQRKKEGKSAVLRKDSVGTPNSNVCIA